MFLKNTKSTKAIISLAAVSLFMTSVAPASAQIVGLTSRPLSEIIASGIDWLLGIAAGLTILFIIIGGIYYVTAAGDDQQMATAKTMITYAVIGLVFIVISYSVVITVNSIITG